jgi:3-isopropylmalate/(R)-2-methylmalate dehydratase small subunit
MGGVVPMRIVSEMRTDPQDIVEHLFEGVIPDFHQLCHPGDIIVTGRNFGMGAKMQGYIAMKALGLGLVCESMSFLAYREAIGIGLPVLTGCNEISSACHQGDELRVDFQNGMFSNITQDRQYQFEPVPLALQDVLSYGGTTGWLHQWWGKKQADKENA